MFAAIREQTDRLARLAQQHGRSNKYQEVAKLFHGTGVVTDKNGKLTVFKVVICLSFAHGTQNTLLHFVGVSCDSCMKANFKGRRYKCLICYDYDLCATCYEAGVTTGRHSTDHAMQCILTRADFGESFLISYAIFSLLMFCWTCV